jgi:hypothetical protein
MVASKDKDKEQETPELRIGAIVQDEQSDGRGIVIGIGTATATVAFLDRGQQIDGTHNPNRNTVTVKVASYVETVPFARLTVLS